MDFNLQIILICIFSSEMNPLKYKKKQYKNVLTNPKSPQHYRYQTLEYNHNFNSKSLKIKNNPQRQYIKLQISYREPKSCHNTPPKPKYCIKNRSLSIQDKEISQSLPKQNQKINKSKAIHNSKILFKKPQMVNKSRESILNSSIEKKSLSPRSPYLDKSRKLLLNNKKINILDRQSHISYRDQNDSINKIKRKSKPRVNSTFIKLESLDTEEKSEKNTISTDTIKLVKKLMKSTQFKQSLLIVKNALERDPKNIQLLELYATSTYNLEEYQKTIQICQTILQLNPDSQIYIINSLSLAKMKRYVQALNVLNQGEKHYPQNAEIFYYKGKVYFHMRNFQEAQQAFTKSYFICSLPQTLLCLADCYKRLNQTDRELKTYEKILKKQKSDSQNHQIFALALSRKLKTLFELERFDDCREEVKKIGKGLKIECESVKSQLFFIQAMCLFKEEKYSKAYEKLEDCLMTTFLYMKALKMMIIIKILQKDFYQASHLANSIQKQNRTFQIDEHFSLLSRFVEGSINLVRRNFKQGIEILSQVELTIQTIDFKKKRKTAHHQLQNQESFNVVKNLIHLFLSYGLFCLQQFVFCQSAITKQKQIYCNQAYEKGLDFNYKLCQVIISYEERHYIQALNFVNEAKKIFPNKLQIHFYQAVILLNIFIEQKGTPFQKIDNHEKLSSKSIKTLNNVKTHLGLALMRVSNTGNNTKATICYYKCLVHCYLGEWKEAMENIEKSIGKSDDNYWRYYYVKAMILACVHNFQAAITELSTAITISQGIKADCFLLRSKCLQIEGRGNQAFYDLQQYIALRPEDEDVHKYAGQLLFENGAFEDAVVAFQHKQIQEIDQHFDVYLTIAKTHFLMGKFDLAHENMMIAARLKQKSEEVVFDGEALYFINDMIKTISTGKSKDLTRVRQSMFNLKSSTQKYGKIFKEIQFILFEAILDLYQDNIQDSLKNWKILMQAKRKQIMFDDENENILMTNCEILNKNEEDIEKISKELKIYSNQMKFNMVICYIKINDIESATKVAKQINLDHNQIFYKDWILFRKCIIEETFQYTKNEVFPNKNKLSQFLKPIQINIKGKHLKIKLCIPFPKVEPPQIFPKFDRNLLRTLNIYGIQGRPQAPWIVKQDNVIRFTQKMEYFSRLDFNDSEKSSESKIVDIDVSNNLASNMYIRNKSSKIFDHESSASIKTRKNLEDESTNKVRIKLQ